MGSSHAPVRPCLIEKYESLRVDCSQPAFVGSMFGYDVGALQLCCVLSFFLKTNPIRWSALKMLERWTRAFPRSPALYAAVSSHVVASGFAASSSRSFSTSTGEGFPPPRASGSTPPVARHRQTHRFRVASPTPNSLATSGIDPSPDSYALTALDRSSTGYGFGIRRVDHRPKIKATEPWD